MRALNSMSTQPARAHSPPAQPRAAILLRVNVIIREAGWATNTNGRGIEPHNVNETFQEQYYQELMEWAEREQVLVYFFEAFDENWKGSDDPLEPEKHWGLFKADRTPKLALQL